MPKISSVILVNKHLRFSFHSHRTSHTKNDPLTISDGGVSGTTQGAPSTFLISDQTFTDFVLKFDIRIQGGPSVPKNSSVQIRRIKDDGVVLGDQADFDARDIEKNATNLEQGNRRLTTNDGSKFADLRDS